MQTFKNKILLLLCGGLLVLNISLPVFASEASSNYKVVISDEADLFTDEEENQLMTLMSESLTYGNMVLLTVNENPYFDTYDLADTYYLSEVGTSKGMIFVIDMDERMLWLSGMDGMDYILDNDYCETITDNAYSYASDGDYYGCATKVFSQVNSLLVGKYVPKPMKHISNVLLSILVALVINYFVAMALSKKSKVTKADWSRNIVSNCNISDTSVTFLRENKVFHPHDDGPHGGGGGGHHSGGGGGHHSSGGGGHHSSGGGHRF